MFSMKKKNMKIRNGRVHFHILPVLVWILAAVATTTLFFQRVAKFEAVGIARADEMSMIATANGRLDRMTVDLFAQVEKGQTLAILQLDSSIGGDTLHQDIQSQMNTAIAELDKLKADLDAARLVIQSEKADRDNDIITTHRRLALDAEQAKIATLEIDALIVPDRVLVQDFNLQIEINEELTKDEQLKDIGIEHEIERLRAQRNSLQSKIDQNVILLKERNNLLSLAEQRLADFTAKEPVPVDQKMALLPLQRAIEVQETLINGITLQRGTKPLIAPYDGVVSFIMCKENQAVLQGDPLFNFVRTQPKDIVAYANPKNAEQLHVTMEVEIIKQSLPNRIAKSQITHVGPAVEMIPERLWASKDVPEYGVPVRIANNVELRLMPNEIVGVRGL